MSEEEKFTLDEAHLKFAKQINGRTWQLLEKEDRTDAEEREMLHAAHAAQYHWLYAGTGVHWQRGQWLISRVHVALGNVAEAVRHAELCLEFTDSYRDEMEDFDFAYAYEGVARANALAGVRDRAANYYALARQAGDEIADDEDREIFLGDFKGGDWYGLA
jgi:hypothetical protein